MPGPQILRRAPLFAGIDDGDLEELAAMLLRRTYARGVAIFHQGSPGGGMYILESGRVRIFLLSELGQEMTINTYGPGQVFGELSLLDGLPRSASALAEEQTTVLALERSDFMQFLDAHPSVAHSVIEMLAARVRYTTAYAQSLVFLDVPGRLAAKLLELTAWTPAGEAELSLSQTELATWVASSRETVNRALHDFESQGLIRLSGQRIVVVDRRGLQRRAQV